MKHSLGRFGFGNTASGSGLFDILLMIVNSNLSKQTYSFYDTLSIQELFLCLFCIFANVKSMGRRISANFLLSIVLSIVFLAPFHHHDEPLAQDISCDDCTHHQPHPGHLSEKAGTDECLICQLLAQVYVPTAGPVVNHLSPDCITMVSNDSGDVILSFTPQSSPRAPPVSFCF